MNKDIPPLPWLRAFDAAARHRNFSLAADELALTPAAVSYQVRSLEERLGYPLFLRKKRPMELTTMGQLYVPWVQRAFALLGQGTRDVFGPRQSRPVRFRCLQSWAYCWLMPRLPTFRRTHPEITLQIHMGSWAGTLDAEQLDLDVRFGDGQWPGVQSIPLCKDPIVPLCHPDLYRNDMTPEQLAQQDLIEIIGVSDTWQQYFLQENVPQPQNPPQLQADQSNAALEMAALGLGHVLVLRTFAEPYLADGRLVPSLKGEKKSDQMLYLVQSKEVIDPDCQRFKDWLLDSLASEA